MQRAALLLALVAAGACSSTPEPVLPTYNTLQDRDDLTLVDTLGSVGNVLPDAEGVFPEPEAPKYELNLGYKETPDGRVGVYFLVTYRGDGWAYLAEGSSALTVVCGDDVYRFTCVKTEYDVIAKPTVFETAWYPAREKDLRAILASSEAEVRISLRSKRNVSRLQPENLEHLRRFYAEEMGPRIQAASLRRQKNNEVGLR